MMMGRRKSDPSRPIEVYQDGESDFCSVKCFVDYLEKKIQERLLEEEIREEKH